MTKEEILKMVADEFKAKGLDIAEDLAVNAVEAVFDVIPKITAATENTLDDMAVPVLALIKPKIMELLDKIDGEDDREE